MTDASEREKPDARTISDDEGQLASLMCVLDGRTLQGFTSDIIEALMQVEEAKWRVRVAVQAGINALGGPDS